MTDKTNIATANAQEVAYWILIGVFIFNHDLFERGKWKKLSFLTTVLLDFQLIPCRMKNKLFIDLRGGLKQTLVISECKQSFPSAMTSLSLILSLPRNYLSISRRKMFPLSTVVWRLFCFFFALIIMVKSPGPDPSLPDNWHPYWQTIY